MAKPVRKKSNSRFAGAIVVVAVVGIAGLGFAVSRPRAGIKPVDPNLAPGTAQGYLLGKADAPVQVMEFGDFECPACGQWATLTEPDVRERLINTGLVAFRFYDFPLDIHKNTWPASNAVACADDQGKFTEMHDRVFATQDQWAGHITTNPKKPLMQAAKDIGLNVDTWEQCFDSQKHYPRIKANLNEGVRRGVGQTPTFVIGNTMYPGNIPFDEFKKYVDAAAAAAEAAAKSAPGKAAPKAAAKSGQ